MSEPWIDRACEAMRQFLEAMPELMVNPAATHDYRVLQECHHGNVADYIQHAWEQFLIQEYEEEDDDTGGGGGSGPSGALAPGSPAAAGGG